MPTRSCFQTSGRASIGSEVLARVTRKLEEKAVEGEPGWSPQRVRAHRTEVEDLMARAGNAAVQQLLEGRAHLPVQREVGIDPRLLPTPEFVRSLTAAGDDRETVEATRAKVVAWLEPQRADIENRARQTSMGFASPAEALTTGGLAALVRQAVPEAKSLKDRRLAQMIKDWIHVSMVDQMGGGQLSDAEVLSAVQAVLGKPGTIRVERKGAAWMEVTAGGVEIGRDDSASADASVAVGWDGSIGASLSVAKVKGSFMISPDRTWQAQIALPAAATPAVLNQIAGVFGAADRAARTVAGRVDATGGHVHDVSVDVLNEGLSPVKDAIDTLTSVVDRDNRVSIGVSASGDFQGSVSVQATITIRW